MDNRWIEATEVDLHRRQVVAENERLIIGRKRDAEIDSDLRQVAGRG